MYPTFIGLIELLIGLPLLFYGRTRSLLVFVMACGPLGGSAALALPALGGSTIPPIYLALGLLIVRLIFNQATARQPIAAAFRDNWPFVGYALYSCALAFIGPRLFAGKLDVVLLRPKPHDYIYAVYPLRPTAQNITTSVYLLGTLSCAVCAYICVSAKDGWRSFLLAAIYVGWANAGLGVLDVASRGTPVAVVFEALRNGSYAQLTHEFGGIARMSGLFAEASIYASYVFVWFCFIFECWYRDVLPRRTGPLAVVLFIILVMSTSSSAYFGLAAYGAMFAIRLLVPGTTTSKKLVPIFLTIMSITVAGALLMAVRPALADQLTTIFLKMTIEKGNTYSGLQRAFWAKRGIFNFYASYGLGVGAGSFRSSSVVSAVLGSAGLAGAYLFLFYILKFLKPLRASTIGLIADPAVATGVAAAWAAFFLIVCESVSLPSCDPGADFGLLAGVAIALRVPTLRWREKRKTLGGRDIDPGDVPATA